MNTKNEMVYNANEHVGMLAGAIDRMGSNHNSWNITSVSVTGLSFSIFTAFIDNENLKLTHFIILVIFTALLYFFTNCMSLKYFKLERQFRTKQKQIVDGKSNWTKFDMNPRTINQDGGSNEVCYLTLMKSWAIWFPMLLSVISFITLIVMYVVI